MDTGVTEDSTRWRRIMKHIAPTISLILGNLTISYTTVQAIVDRPPYSDPAVMSFYPLHTIASSYNSDSYQFKFFGMGQ